MPVSLSDLIGKRICLYAMFANGKSGQTAWNEFAIMQALVDCMGTKVDDGLSKRHGCC
jgi:hypothetical protein